MLTIIVLRLILNINGKTGADNTKDVGVIVTLEYLSNLWRTLEMPLVNCEMNLMLQLKQQHWQ